MTKKIILVIVLTLIVCMSLIPVAAADTITETNGLYTYTMARLVIPVCVQDNSLLSYSVLSAAITMTERPNDLGVRFSSYFWSAGYDSGNSTLDPEQADPYRFEGLYGYNNVYNVMIPLFEYEGAESGSVPACIFFSEEFYPYVESIEIGTYWDGNIGSVFNSTIKGYLDQFLKHYTYIKYTSVNGSYAIIAFKSADPTLPDNSVQIAASMPYRKYYLETQRDPIYDQTIRQEGYDQGFAQGVATGDQYQYDQGYAAGLTQGYQNGINDSVADYTTFAGWARAVLSLLDIKLFGTFGLAELLAIGVGIAVLAFVFKLLRN